MPGTEWPLTRSGLVATTLVTTPGDVKLSELPGFWSSFDPWLTLASALKL